MKRNPPKVIALIPAAVMIVLILVAAGSIISCAPQTDTPEPVVMVTNIRERTFTVSWTTAGETTGEIHFGSDPNNLDQVAVDDRGANTIDDTHYVTITALAPQTTYYFDVHSNVIIDDNNGNHYTATTGATIGIPASDTVYGQVFKSDGITPAEGCIVYVTLEGVSGTSDSGKAAPLSSFTDGNGWWYANLADSRVPDMSAFFTYSQDDDQIHLDAQCANDGSVSTIVATGNDAPAPNLVVKTMADSGEKTFLPLTINK